MIRPSTLLALVALAALAGCGSGTPPRKDGAREAQTAARVTPAICGHVTVRRTGRIHAPQATELSGLVLSRRRPGVLWTHNDSGDAPRLLAVRASGRLVGDVAVTGASAIDWEDIAIRGGTLYVGDIGDNKRSRPEVVVYRVPEPAAGATQSAPATALRLRYPDGPHD